MSYVFSYIELSAVLCLVSEALQPIFQFGFIQDAVCVNDRRPAIGLLKLFIGIFILYFLSEEKS